MMFSFIMFMFMFKSYTMNSCDIQKYDKRVFSIVVYNRFCPKLDDVDVCIRYVKNDMPHDIFDPICHLVKHHVVFVYSDVDEKVKYMYEGYQRTTQCSMYVESADVKFSDRFINETICKLNTSRTMYLSWLNTNHDWVYVWEYESNDVIDKLLNIPGYNVPEDCIDSDSTNILHLKNEPKDWNDCFYSNVVLYVGRRNVVDADMSTSFICMLLLESDFGKKPIDEEDIGLLWCDYKKKSSSKLLEECKIRKMMYANRK
jgi:hypothetical protein